MICWIIKKYPLIIIDKFNDNYANKKDFFLMILYSNLFLLNINLLQHL